MMIQKILYTSIVNMKNRLNKNKYLQKINIIP